MRWLSKSSSLQKQRPSFIPSPKRNVPMKVVSSKKAPSLPEIPEFSAIVPGASTSNIEVSNKVPSPTETPGCSYRIRDPPSSKKIKGILKKPNPNTNLGISTCVADASTIISESLRKGSTTPSTTCALTPITPSDETIFEVIDLTFDDDPLPFLNGEHFKEVTFDKPNPEASGIKVQAVVAETPQSGLDKDTIQVTPKRRGKPRKLMPISNGIESVKTRSKSKTNGIIGTDNDTTQIKKRRRRHRRRPHEPYSFTPKKLKNEATSLTHHEKSLDPLQKKIRNVSTRKICLAVKIRSLEEIESTLTQKHYDAVRRLVIQGTGPEADNRARKREKILTKIENMIISLQHLIARKIDERETDATRLLAQSNKRSSRSFCCKFCLERRNRQLSNLQ